MPRPPQVPSAYESLLRKLASGDWGVGRPPPPSRELGSELHIAARTALAAMQMAQRDHLVRIIPRRGAVVLPDAPARAARKLARMAAEAAQQAAILVPEQHVPPRDPFYRSLIRSLIAEGAERGIRLDVAKLPAGRQMPTVKSLPSRGFRAAVFVAFTPDYLPALMLLLERRFPVMVFNRRLPGLEVPSVRIDDEASTRRVVELFAAAGHRNLCMLIGLFGAGSWSGTGRAQGWAHGLREQALEASCLMPMHILPPFSVGYPAASGPLACLMTQPNRPTAVACCGHVAVQHLRAACARRLCVPRDLSVVALEPGGRPMAVPGWPPLTTVQIDIRRAAQCCAELVARMLAGEPNPPSIRVPEDITLTESVAPPP